MIEEDAVTNRKEPYVVVFDPATGLKKSTPDEKTETSESQKQYGDLRIRSGGTGFGTEIPVWLVWSIAKQAWEIEITQQDLNNSRGGGGKKRKRSPKRKASKKKGKR